MSHRIFADAPAQSTCASVITSSQTSVVLQSTANFPVPAGVDQFSVVILDAGNPGYNPASPFTTPFEYQQVNGNNTGTNTLTFGTGGGAAARSSYAGTTPRGFFAGALVAAVPLAEDWSAAFPRIDLINTTPNLGLVPVKIDSVTVGAPSAVWYDSNTNYPSGLPSGFRHLELIYVVFLSATAGDLGIRFNNDSSAIYDFQALEGTPSNTATSTNTAATTYIRTGATASTTAPSSGRILIPLYNSTTIRKTAVFTGTRQDGNGSTYAEVNTGQWRSTSAVTRIQMLTTPGTVAAGSTIDVYGLP